jgi:hypothetical protein
MIDCLYTGPATDSIDCSMGLEPAWLLFLACTPLDFINPRIFECDDRWNVPAKTPQSLQDRVPEKV